MISLGVPFVPGNDDWMPHPDHHPASGLGHPDFVDHYPFVRFDAAGAITATGAMARAHILRERLMSGGIMIGVGHWDSDYVDLSSGEPVIRPLTDCPAVLEGLVLRALPVPCTVEIASAVEAPARYPWSAPALTLAFDLPGTYAVRVLATAHRPGRFTVSADG